MTYQSPNRTMMDCIVENAMKEAIQGWVEAMRTVRQECETEEKFTTLMLTLCEEIIHCQYATEDKAEPISFAAAGMLMVMIGPDKGATEEECLEWTRSEKYIKAAIAWGLINKVSDEPETMFIAELFPDEYLRAKGIDPDAAVERLLKKIEELKSQIKAEHDGKNLDNGNV